MQKCRFRFEPSVVEFRPVIGVRDGLVFVSLVLALQNAHQFIGLIIIIYYLCMIQLKVPTQDKTSFYSSFDVKSETSTEGEENQFACEGIAHLRGTIRNTCSKAKSSLCRNFTEKGYCPYGVKCQFAHGPEQLRINMEHNRSYKTKGCHAFAKKGYCCYGERCNFIHEQPREESSPAEYWARIYSNHRTTINPPEVSSSSRLLRMLGL